MNMQTQKSNTYDAIVIGSGITGGWAAKELTEKGLQTIVLEAGQSIVPERDYVEHVPTWDIKFRGMRDRKYEAVNQPIQRHIGDEWNSKFFVNDIENPYTTPPDQPYLFLRGRHVGGRSVMWGRQSYRWSDLDFEANLKDGHGVDWPVRYKDVEPWYDYVEDFIGVTGQAENLPQLPDGKFLPPMEMNCAELVMKDVIAQKFPDRRLTIGRTAILTVPHRGRAACHYCGPCARGCITRSYFSSIHSTLPAAEATGKLTMRPFSVVHSLIFDPKTRKITGVRVIDGQTKEAMEFHAKVVFLCASTLESARILLNSATPEFSTGLANSSGELGHNLMDHIMGGGATGIIPGHEDRQQIGNRPNGIYVPRFRNVKDKHPGFVRGYGFQGGGGRDDWGRGSEMLGFGADFKHTLHQPGPWRFTFAGFGECLPNHENHLEIDKDKVDAWGIPTMKISHKWRENEYALLKDMQVTGAEMLEAAGAKDITLRETPSAPGEGIHEMGSARMGRDPKTSVLNSWNQAHDIKNLFVTDGSFMVSSACQNPSLTYMAMTARACDYAVKQMKSGDL
ncbi:MAG: GMC family oxidoreductase [Edaphobacter sp.]|uniref:GMC oxidoreductase n=1 Tax=Edaphobacter sp. TaxID=1934404 RepID=UPI0023A49264|nr:GMC family oxidoreductase [Edaphobacter sp.]MDE1178049.1 GMC family oxidoreductase [Edaphobacter sp.]